MTASHPIPTTGIYPNQETQCFEAWVVDEKSRHRALVSTCSMSVPPEQIQWWQQQVWTTWMPEWGVSRALVPGRF